MAKKKTWQTIKIRDLQRGDNRRRKTAYPGTVLDTALPPLPKRSECRDGPRPCPHVRCRYHLAVEALPTGTLRIYAEDPADLVESCSLDVAERGGASQRQLAIILGVTTQRANQMEFDALLHLKQIFLRQGLSEADIREIMARNALPEIARGARFGDTALAPEDTTTSVRDAANACLEALDEKAGIKPKPRRGFGFAGVKPGA